jgi:hypothetical protein
LQSITFYFKDNALDGVFLKKLDFLNRITNMRAKAHHFVDVNGQVLPKIGSAAQI